MRILFLSRWFPFPPSNGSKLRIFHLLRGLAKHHEIILLSFADQLNIDHEAPEIRSLCRDIQIVPWRAFDPRGWRARLGFLNQAPRSVIDTFSPEMANKIERLLDIQQFDLIIASQWMMASYARYFRGLAALFEEVEIGALHQLNTHPSAWFRLRYRLTWSKQRRHLSRLSRYFRACTVVSHQERKLLSENVPNYSRIEVIPNCINLCDYDIQEEVKPHSLIFTGPFRYRANYAAMLWFLREVHPLIWRQVSGVSLSITGDHANLPLPPAEGVELTGFVDDVRPLIARSWISIVPIHSGGGTRLKILEAMALGTPVVSTSKGAEGLDAQHDVHLLIADTPEGFARAVVRLFQETGLRERLATQARQLIREKYDWPVVMPRFLNLVESIFHE